MAPGKIISFTASDLVAKARKLRSTSYHWEALDLDVVIRPRTVTETAALFDEGQRLAKEQEEYAGTADAVPSIESYRLRMRYAIPCILDREGAQVLTEADVEELLSIDVASLNEILTEVDAVSNFTQAQREEQAKNSAETEAAKSSSVSPAAVAIPGSSPTPTPSDS